MNVKPLKATPSTRFLYVELEITSRVTTQFAVVQIPWSMLATTPIMAATDREYRQRKEQDLIAETQEGLPLW